MSQSTEKRMKERKERVRVESNTLSNTYTDTTSDTYAPSGIDSAFNFADFKENFTINILDMNQEQMIFEMIGIDAPFANAFRRILISEIPTMAIDQVYIYDNTSIIMDEVLSHRLGLIPIKADPRLFDFRTDGDEVSENNTLVFKMTVKCTKNPAPKDRSGADQYLNSNVLSNHLIGQQSSVLNDESPMPVNDDILIAKLRPGQSIDLEAHCQKGIGKVHAKWSPVATASYRLLPEIKFTEDIVGKEADELVKRCPTNVFDIEDLGKVRRAVVARPRDCSMCRECIREPPFTDKIKLMRVKDHFIFSIESTGILDPQTLFTEAIQILQKKCETAKQLLDAAAAARA